MPVEFRDIMLSDAETIKALSAILWLRGEKRASLINPFLVLSREESGQPLAILVFPQKGPGIEFQFNSTELLAALINFCMEEKIPIPRNAEKKADVANQQLMLRLRWNV